MKEKVLDRPIPESGPVTALGLMSGTSLDGVDAAILETDGARILGFGPTRYRPYDAAEREVLAAALGQWSGPAVTAAAEVVEAAHLELVRAFPEAEVIGFHGQTLAHAPRAQGTLQAGDGARLADAAGRTVVWDFRSADVAAGGEGAPLAPFFHFACARHIGAQAPLAFLNLGGVGNLTFADSRLDRPEAPGALLAFDTGPANAPIDDLLRSRRGMAYDRDGALAARGRVDATCVARFLDAPYFSRTPPKSLDRNEFAAAVAEVETLSDADAAATLAAMAAAAVAEGLRHLPERPASLLVTGGGRRNPVLMRMLQERTGGAVAPVEDAGLDGDMLEAQAFAHLAVRVLRGWPTSCAGTTGVSEPVCGGRISAPEPRSLRARA